MNNITDIVLELVRITATDLPPDVENALCRSTENELPGSIAQSVLNMILTNVKMARHNSTPICQDTGTPIFYVQHPEGWSTRKLRKQIHSAVIEATRKAYLRPNSVNSTTGKNTGNNTGDKHFPIIHLIESDDDTLSIDLILKGGGCENVSAQYSLPDDRLGAARDLEGVWKVALDAAFRAQGKGCPPGILGIAVGGSRSSSYAASNETLLRPLDDINPDPTLASLEERITTDINMLGIGPMGLGGKTTLLATKITSLHRLPACYFVSIAYMCWAYRRRRMVLNRDQASYF